MAVMKELWLSLSFNRRFKIKERHIYFPNRDWPTLGRVPTTCAVRDGLSTQGKTELLFPEKPGLDSG